MIRKYNKSETIQLSKNFKSNEFACKCGCKTFYIDDELITKLQLIRDYCGKAVLINSGYRCREHNKKIGGASSSQHTRGTAADIRVTGFDPSIVFALAEQIGFDGIGKYKTFTHVDTRGWKARWRG